jgi:hypothetical protein
MVTFTINIPQMLAYIPNMDPMGNDPDFEETRDVKTHFDQHSEVKRLHRGLVFAMA